jgi:hypothetical protein
MGLVPSLEQSVRSGHLSAPDANPTSQRLIVLPDTDQVTLSSSLVIKSQSIGVASTTQGFSDVDGILGYCRYSLLPCSITPLTFSHYAASAQLTLLRAPLEETHLYRLSQTISSSRALSPPSLSAYSTNRRPPQVRSMESSPLVVLTRPSKL